MPIGPVVDEHGSAAAATQFVEARVGGDAVRPGGERRAAVEAVDAAHDGDECVLGCVGCVGVAAGDAPADGENAVVVAAQEGVECGPIAAGRGLNERVVVDRHPVAANRSSVMVPRYGLSPLQESDAPS